MGLIKDVIVVFAAIIIALTVSVELTGSISAGMSGLCLIFVANAARERMSNKQLKNENELAKK